MERPVFSSEALFIPEPAVGGRPITALNDPVIAVELIRTNRGGRLGGISRLPEGACLDVCGPGYNEKTVKVRWRDKYYFVMRDDLPMA